MTGYGLISINKEAALTSMLAGAASMPVIRTAAGTATGCLTTRTIGTPATETSKCLWILSLRIPRMEALRAISTALTLTEDTTGVSSAAEKLHRLRFTARMEARTLRMLCRGLRRLRPLTSQSVSSPGSNMSTTRWMPSMKLKAATTPDSAREMYAQKSPEPVCMWASRTLTHFGHAWAGAQFTICGTATAGLSLLKRERHGSTSSLMTVTPLAGD